MGNFSFTRLERISIMRVCIDIAYADGYINGDENDMLDEIANDIDLTRSDLRSIHDIDFETAFLIDIALCDPGPMDFSLQHFQKHFLPNY